MTGPTAMRLGWYLAGVVVFVGAAVWRVVSEGHAELAASDAAWRAGDTLGATVHARASARAYAPFAAHVPRAYRRLRAIAENSEGKGDAEAALFAWRSIRASAIGSRSLVNTHDREREAADAAIARLSAGPRLGSGPRPSEASPAGDIPPRAGWAALLLSGVALWVAAGFRLTSKGWDAEGHFQPTELRVPLAVAALGLGAWWLGLFMA